MTCGRFRFLVFLLLPVVAGSLLSPGVVLASEFPVSSTGDIWFHADHAGFLDEEDRVLEEFYFRITNNQLDFLLEDEVFVGRIYVKLTFKDEEGSKLGNAARNFEFAASTEELATSAEHAQLLVFREPLDVRTRFVEAEIEDRNARKRGILYLFTGKRKNGRAEGSITPPPFAQQEWGLSDLQFAWEVRPEEEGSAFVKHGLNVIPNPSRNYGLMQPRLSVFYEVYDRRELEESPRRYVVRHELVDPSDNLIPSRPDSVTSPSGEWVKVVSFDMSNYATGQYLFRARVIHPESGEEVVSERSFNLLWDSEFWGMSEGDLLAEAKVLFEEEEYERFREMAAGDRAEYAQKFWADHDPTPGSAVNELRQQFLHRVAYANRQYADHRKGMLTDRGRIHIRFGDPDQRDQVLVPSQSDQLDRVVPYLVDENPAGARTLATNDTFDNRPYEIWHYDRQGSPLFPEREVTTSRTGLRFIFVDESGTGTYVLRYSSDFIGY